MSVTGEYTHLLFHSYVICKKIAVEKDDRNENNISESDDKRNRK